MVNEKGRLHIIDGVAIDRAYPKVKRTNFNDKMLNQAKQIKLDDDKFLKYKYTPASDWFFKNWQGGLDSNGNFTFDHPATSYLETKAYKEYKDLQKDKFIDSGYFNSGNIVSPDFDQIKSIEKRIGRPLKKSDYYNIVYNSKFYNIPNNKDIWGNDTRNLGQYASDVNTETIDTAKNIVNSAIKEANSIPIVSKTETFLEILIGLSLISIFYNTTQKINDSI
jgi:hypothetical protein